jgi:two-component system, chemotaxis family, chemotaxis protein CheV
MMAENTNFAKIIDMANLSSKKDNKGILLESGTNEIEVFAFIVAGQTFGVNALKIAELSRFTALPLTRLPKINNCILGTVLFRDKIVPVVSLTQYLKLPDDGDESKKVVLFCDFNKQIIGFLIDQISGIHRMSWQDIQPPNMLLSKSTITGVAVSQGHEIAMLDFELLTETILNPQGHQPTTTGPSVSNVSYDDAVILACDDAPIIRKKLRFVLEKAGFKKLKIFDNGQELFNEFEKLVSLAKGAGEPLQKHVSLIVTDIEMPRMDGLTLCKKIKDSYPQIPIVIMSSMINDQISVKCNEVGADESLSKSDFDLITKSVEKHLFNH